LKAADAFAESGLKIPATISIARMAQTSESKISSTSRNTEGLLEAILRADGTTLSRLLETGIYCRAERKNFAALGGLILTKLKSDHRSNNYLLRAGRSRKEGNMVLMTKGFSAW